MLRSVDRSRTSPAALVRIEVLICTFGVSNSISLSFSPETAAAADGEIIDLVVREIEARHSQEIMRALGLLVFQVLFLLDIDRRIDLKLN